MEHWSLALLLGGIAVQWLWLLYNVNIRLQSVLHTSPLLSTLLWSGVVTKPWLRRYQPCLHKDHPTIFFFLRCLCLFILNNFLRIAIKRGVTRSTAARESSVTLVLHERLNNMATTIIYRPSHAAADLVLCPDGNSSKMLPCLHNL